MFSTRASPSLKTNHYSPQPSASVNNVIYHTLLRFATIYYSHVLIKRKTERSSEATNIIVLTKTTAAQNEVALTYHRVCGLYFLTVVFVGSIGFVVV